ncbi:hypothetical protein P4O66_008604, partial [Electrophorus voltai]
SEDVVINIQKQPELDYDHSSVFSTLKAYSDALYEAWGRRSNFNKQRRDQNILEPSHLQADVLDHYAEMLCGDILDVALKRRGAQSTDDGMGCPPDKTDNKQSEVIRLTMSNQEGQAMRLASEIYSRALEEIATPNSLTGSRLGELSNVMLPKHMDQTDSISEVHSEPAQCICSSACQPGMEVDTKKMDDHDRTHSHDRPIYDACSRDQTSGSATYYHPLNGMASMGSLDYPDAPPSTPLLPGMMRSRDSFTRKLKGGLAKEFMPSPPPPTPKDQQAESLLEDKMAETATNNSEFVVRLMRSLTVACAQCGDLDEEEQGIRDEGRFQTGISMLSDYAARLSADIIHCITTTQPCVNIKEGTPIRDVHFLADHLAEEILLMSIAEVIGSKGLDGKVEENSPSFYAEEQMPDAENRTQVPGNALVPRSSPDVPAMEVLRDFSGKLVTNILAQSFSELGVCALQYSPSTAAEPVGGAVGSNLYPSSCLDTTKCHQITALDSVSWELLRDYITDDSRAATLTAECSFAESTVDEVLQCSIQEPCASPLRYQIISDRFSSSPLHPRTSEHTVMKGILSDTRHYELQELQCILLWVAASHMGVSVLRLHLPEGHVQQQLCSLSLRARFRGWTAGDLMGSLLQYYEDLQAASRGH